MSRRSSGEGTAGAVLGAAARILIYGAVLAFLVWGVRAGYRFGEEILPRCHVRRTGEDGGVHRGGGR